MIATLVNRYEHHLAYSFQAERAARTVLATLGVHLPRPWPLNRLTEKHEAVMALWEFYLLLIDMDNVVLMNGTPRLRH